MHAFVVVLAPGGARLPASVLAFLHDGARPDLPFQPTIHRVWSNSPHTVWFAGWRDHEETATAPGWHESPDGLIAFTGHLWPRTDGWPTSGPWAPQLADHLARTPLWEGADDLAGVFVAASLADDGRSAVASDPLGIGLVYWSEQATLTVISSRASLVAQLVAAARGTGPEKDVLGTGWMAYSGFPMGLDTGFRDVALIPPGAVVDIDRAGRARLLHPPVPLWRSQPAQAGGATAALGQIEREVTIAIHTALATAGPAGPSAGLTGGIDSRLILAVLLADGSAEDVRFLTFGAEDLPDVSVARQIAARFNLRHEVNPPLPDRGAWRGSLLAAIRAGGHADMADREIAFRVSVQVSSASRNIADGLGIGPSAGDQMLLSGLCGEAFRSNYPWAIRFRSKAAVAALPEGLKYGQAGVLRPEARDHYRARAHELLFDGTLATDSPQDVSDAFYLRNRLRRWLGADHEVRWGRRWFPLYSTTAVRLASSIGAENRHARWIAYHLMRRACAPLVNMEFAEGGWPAGASGGLVAPRQHHDAVPERPVIATGPPTPVTGETVRSVARDARAALESVDVEIMRRVLRDDPSNPVFSIIDPAAAASALDRFSTLNQPQRMQLYGATTAALWLGDHEIGIPHPIVA